MARHRTPAQVKDFVDYLTDTLIPDLKESGRDATAEDFETAVEIIKQLSGRRSSKDDDWWQGLFS